MSVKYKYHHVGLPTEKTRKGMIHIGHLRIYASDHESNPFGVQWMKYEEGCKVPDLVRENAHVAFEVDDLQEALKGKKVIIEPNSPSPGVLVAFIEEAGAPIELLQYLKKKRNKRPGHSRTGPG